MHLSVINLSREPWRLPFTAGELAHAVTCMAKAMSPAAQGVRPDALELSILDDADMAALNRDFLGLLGPTNVLSFPAASSRPGLAATASLALAVPTICREARLYGQDLQGYTLKMLAHGLAHVFGYDHGPLMDVQVEQALGRVVI